MQDKTRRSRPLSHQITWLLLVALLIVAGLVVYTFIVYRNAAVSLLIERDRQLVYLSASRLREELTAFPDTLLKLSREPAVTSRDLNTRFLALKRSAAVEQGIFDGGVILLNNFGTVVATAPPRPDILGQSWSDREYFRHLLVSPGPYYSNALHDGLSDSPSAVISVPVYDESGQFHGVLVGVLRLGESAVSPLYAKIVRLRIGQSGGTYVVDGNGSVLFDSESETVGLPFSEQVLPDVALNSQGDAVRTVDANGNDVVASYAPIPGTPWTLVIEEDWQTLTQDTRRYLNLLIILLGIGVTLPIAGAVLLIGSRNAEQSEHAYLVEKQSVARVVKDSLLREEHLPTLPDWHIVVHHREKSGADGDYYDFLLLPNGCLVIAAGDTGLSGVESGLLYATVRATLRGAARSLLSPAQILSYANEALTPETPPDVAITCFLGLVDPGHNMLHFANAQFNCAFYRGEDAVAALPSTGPALAMTMGSTYAEEHTLIRPGHLVFLCSDSLLEASNGSGEPFGVSRLVEIVRRHEGEAEDLVEAVRSALAEFAGSGWEEESGCTVIVAEHMV